MKTSSDVIIERILKLGQIEFSWGN